jgi:hypothetical protein
VEGGSLTPLLRIIVSRTVPSRFTYLKHVFASETVEVILDRRVKKRRQSGERVAAEKRHAERRQQDITEDLQKIGWALVRRRQ